MFWIPLLFIPLTVATKIRCYSGTKYVFGQEVEQDTEDCGPILGLGDPYCYKFVEETSVNEVVKLGCSNIICTAIRNVCMEEEMFGVKGKLCCCNDRHYCNDGDQPMLAPILIPFLLFFVVVFEVMISDI